MSPGDPYLSPDSLAVNDDVLAKMRKLTLETGEVHAIHWAQERSARIPGDGWRDLGEGPFLSGERAPPANMLWRRGDFVFVVRLPAAVLDARRPTRLAVGLNGALMLL